MASYVVTGASRGIGYAFIQHFAQASSSNIVVGLVRNKAATEAKLKEDGLKNVTIIQADVTDRDALAKAADQVSKLTGGKLDYLINNAAYLGDSTDDVYRSFTDLGSTKDGGDTLEKEMLDYYKVNVIGVINVTNAFMPLILKSDIKKVVLITSGAGELEFTNEFEVYQIGPYSVSKAAANMVMAKYSAAHKKDGVLFLSLSPGVVDTGLFPEGPPSPLLQGFFAKFAAYAAKYAPDWKGPIKPEESVRLCVKVIEEKSVEKGDAAAIVSQNGDKVWL